MLLLGLLGLLAVGSHVALLQPDDLHCEDAGCVAVLMVIAVATGSAWAARRFTNVAARRWRTDFAAPAPALVARANSVRLGLPPPPELGAVLRR